MRPWEEGFQDPHVLSVGSRVLFVQRGSTLFILSVITYADVYDQAAADFVPIFDSFRVER